MTVPATGTGTRFEGPGVVDLPRTGPHADTLSLISLAVLAFALAIVAHEALGHGGACLLVGGTPNRLTSVSFDCDVRSGSASAITVAAGGTIVNFVCALFAMWRYSRRRDRQSSGALFLWLFATINVLQGFGYFLFSGVGRIGDWAEVMAAVHPEWLWRACLAVGGFAAYWLATARAFDALGTLVGGERRVRVATARRIAWTAYATGGTLHLLSGLLNPGGYVLLAISAAASLGGTSGLAWGVSFLRGEARRPEALPAMRIRRDTRMLIAALVTALIFVGVLGPGIRLR